MRLLPWGHLAGYQAYLPFPGVSKDHPFWGMKNVMMSPRIGGMSDIYDQQIMPIVTHNIRCLAQGHMDDMRNIVR